MDFGVIAIVAAVATPVVTGALAWGGTRQALNGTRERVKDIGTVLDNHITEGSRQHTELCERVAVVETKVDNLK